MNIKFEQKDLEWGIYISEKLLSELEEKALSHYPNEFGGILIGYYSDDKKKAHVIQQMSPTVYKNSPTKFTREVADLNSFLAQIHIATDGQMIYLGEWHSHPNGSTGYSKTDYQSMESIAKDKNIAVNNPLMLIVGGVSQSINLTFYVYKNSKLYSYEKI